MKIINASELEIVETPTDQTKHLVRRYCGEEVIFAPKTHQDGLNGIIRQNGVLLNAETGDFVAYAFLSYGY